MGIKDMIEAQVKKTGQRCSICAILGNLPDDDAKELRECLAATRDSGQFLYTHSQIERALKANGQILGQGAVSNHRIFHGVA